MAVSSSRQMPWWTAILGFCRAGQRAWIWPRLSGQGVTSGWRRFFLHVFGPGLFLSAGPEFLERGNFFQQFFPVLLSKTIVALFAPDYYTWFFQSGADLPSSCSWVSHELHTVSFSRTIRLTRHIQSWCLTAPAQYSVYVWFRRGWRFTGWCWSRCSPCKTRLDHPHRSVRCGTPPWWAHAAPGASEQWWCCQWLHSSHATSTWHRSAFVVLFHILFNWMNLKFCRPLEQDPGRFQLMFPEIWILGFGNFDLRFLASNYSFVPGRSPEPKVQIFRLWKSNLQDRKFDIKFRVPGTYEQLPGDF